MVTQEKDADAAYSDFQGLIVDKLNLDLRTANQAWDSYKQIRTRFNLEGDQLNWFGCAVFVACRNTVTPTVGQSVLEGNCVSLTSLLRCSNLSLVQFFNKIQSWSDMTRMPEEFRTKINHLQSKLTVTYNTFHSQYTPTFIKLFNPPVDTESRHNRNRKQKPAPCSTKRIFEFFWLMFITVKGEDKIFDENLVTSYQLLYALFDYVFRNAYLDDRKDLINPNFSGLPGDWNSEYRAPNAEVPCIIEILYEHKEDISDVKYIKEYTFNKIIKSWFDKKILQGNADNLTGILNASVFETNFNSLTKVYETHLLNDGDFDERIFLKEYFRQKSLKDLHSGETIAAGPVAEMKGPLKAFATPLTCRPYLQPENISDTITTVPQNISRLKNIIAGRGPRPSEEFEETVLRLLASDPTDSIKAKITELQSKYRERCQREMKAPSPTEMDSLRKRSDLAVILTYKLLEDIIRAERRSNFDVAALVDKVEFLSSIFICSVEIIEFTFNNYQKSPRKFPWILDALDVQPFNMVKIIEITIRSTNGQLPRNIIKHLISIEETCLESQMWKSQSILWQEIERDGNGVPKFEDVALPQQMNRHFNMVDRQELAPGLVSPAPSAVETFQSPMVNSLAKKKLFPDIRPGQSLLQNNHTSAATHIVLDTDGTKKVVRLSEPAAVESPTVMASPAAPDARPRKGGRLGIIMRKFYNLAGIRMFELCKALDINDLQQKIWTVLEYSIRKTDLMKDRHLDQLLMCAIYVVCKIANRSVSFTEHIIHMYRNQPQATSDVYRKVNVLCENGTYDEIDLIKFYNDVYTEKVKDLVKRFKPSDHPNTVIQQSRHVPLSPLPSDKVLRMSPRTEILKNVFVKPYDSPTRMITEKSMNYCFNRSTSADLKQINAEVNNAKRKFQDDWDKVRSYKKQTTKMAALIEERKIQNKETKNSENREAELQDTEDME